MSISIIIRRTIKDEKLAAMLAPLIVKLRSQATVQPGYITGQAFSSLDRDGEYLVISTWNHVEDWNIWMRSEEREAIQRQIDELTGGKTQCRYYEPIVSGIMPKFEAAML